jgi:anti-anti-sigma factor
MDWDETVGTADDARRVFDSVPMLLCAIAGDDHRYVAANAAYREFAARPVVGRPLREVFPEVEGQYIADVLDRVYRTGKPQSVREWRIYSSIYGLGVQELYFDFSATPYHRADGSIEGVQFAIADVTERVRQRPSVRPKHELLPEMLRALLSPSVPVLPGIDVAAEYLVAGPAEAGGDWFDAIALDGVLILVVGDVAGQGVEAAAVMGQLRAALRTHLLEGRSIEKALAALDRFSAAIPGAAAATLCIAVIDGSTGDLEYCTAGHPPPLLLNDNGAAEFLPPSGAGSLGSGMRFRTARARLGVGAAILLYTDGIIDRPGRQKFSSTVEFAETAATILADTGRSASGPGDRPIDRLCAQTIERLVQRTGWRDDVTLIVAQRSAPRPPMHLVVPADDAAAKTVRGRLREWLFALGAEDGGTMVVEHATGEFVDNAVEHAYRGQNPGVVTVDADLLDDGVLRVSVADTGRWQSDGPQSPERGRGLALANMFVTSTRVRGGDHGTTAELTHRLTRPVRIAIDPARLSGSESHSPAPDFRSCINSHGITVVSGDVDSRAAVMLDGRISAASRAGTIDLVLDLNNVTHLGSAAVAVLTSSRSRAEEHETSLTLRARPGTVAHHVLSLARLPVSSE